MFRSSFGMITQDLMTYTLNTNFEEYFATASIQAPPGDPRPVFYLSQGRRRSSSTSRRTAPCRSSGTNFSNRNASWFDPNMRMPYIMNWSGGFQWNFTQNWLLEATYQGSRGVGLLNGWDINQIPLNISTDPNVLRTIFQSRQNLQAVSAVRNDSPLLELRGQLLSRRHIPRGEAILGRPGVERVLHVLEVAEQRRRRRRH